VVVYTNDVAAWLWFGHDLSDGHKGCKGQYDASPFACTSQIVLKSPPLMA